jgi:hypothetical protein
MGHLWIIRVNLPEGKWYDHEAGVGGKTTLSLIRYKLKCSKAQALEWLRQEGLITGEGAPAAKVKGPTYFPYVDEYGEVLFRVVKGAGWYSQQSPGPNGSTWINGIKGVRRVLYRLPDVLSAIAQGRTVWIVEGEKDVDNLWQLGIAATCNPGGAGEGNWRHEYSNNTLKGADVVLCGDNDKAGRDHMEAIERSLTGRARMIRILDLTRTWPECPEKGDVTNWIESHCPNSGDALVRLAEQARVSTVCLHEALIRIMRHPRVMGLPYGAQCAVWRLVGFWDGANNGDLFLAASQFGRSRRITNQHLREAVEAGVLIMTEKGKGTRSTRYAIDPDILFPLRPGVSPSVTTGPRKYLV